MDKPDFVAAAIREDCGKHCRYPQCRDNSCDLYLAGVVFGMEAAAKILGERELVLSRPHSWPDALAAGAKRIRTQAAKV